VRGSTGILSRLNLTFGQGSPSLLPFLLLLSWGGEKGLFPLPNFAGGGGKAVG